MTFAGNEGSININLGEVVDDDGKLAPFAVGKQVVKSVVFPLPKNPDSTVTGVAIP